MKTLILMRVTGFLLSLLLTVIAFFIIFNPTYFHLDATSAVMLIMVFALAQSLVQLIFFINLWKEDGPPWNLGIFLSTVSIIFIIVFFSIWIINHLNYNMVM